MISIEEANDIVLGATSPLPVTEIPLDEAGGYVLAEPVNADADAPNFDRSMMDGYAFSTSSVSEADEIEFITIIAAGESFSETVPSGKAVKIMTGAPVPDGCDAVVPVEKTTQLSDNSFQLNSGVKSGDNIALQGEEMKKGQEVLTGGKLIDPPVAAVLAMTGNAKVKVHRRPRVGILVTGTELVGPDETPGPGKIRESNSYGLVTQCKTWGAVPHRLGQAGDDPDQLRSAIKNGLDFDVLCITGGVSMGDYDYVPGLLKELGVNVLFHKVAQKPAKPILFGKHDSTLVFGLPGNPVASFVGFELYAGPAVRRLAGEIDFRTQWYEGLSSGEFKIKTDRTNLKPVRIERSGNGLLVHPVPTRGSADICSVAGTNAFARFEEGRYTVPSGRPVRFMFHRSKEYGT
jgi:molybdopterin molybdotransferase